MKRLWTSLPNFVDCEKFHPSADLQEKQACRRTLGLPEEAFVVGCVAAVKKNHKRVDHLIREFARIPSSPFLVVAGARTDETDELLALAESLIPGRYRILTDCGRDQMPGIYRAMDVFALASLFEMMPIALLEALASGLPCLTHSHPVMTWMTGAGGLGLDMSREGGLAASIQGITPEWMRVHSAHARERAVKTFSPDAVIPQYVAYYRKVLEA